MKYLLCSVFFMMSCFLLEAKTPAKPGETKITLTVNQVISDGKYLKLSDGSFWEIEPDYIPITGSWLMAPDVTIRKSPDPIYPYEMTNTTSNTKVLAKKIMPDFFEKEKVQTPEKRATVPTPHSESPKPQKRPFIMPKK